MLNNNWDRSLITLIVIFLLDTPVVIHYKDTHHRKNILCNEI